MLAGIMLFAAVLLGQVAVLMAAYVIFGLAIGNAFPIIISQAGSAAGGDRLRDISIVVGFAYVGLITGPALLGVIAHFAGLDATIITLAGFFGGRWLDGQLQTQTTFQISLTFVGFLIGIYNLINRLKK